MNGSVVEFPGASVKPAREMGIETAREIVADPDLHSGAEIVAACKVLFEHGSREDVRMVLDLQRAGIVAGFEQLEQSGHDASWAAARRERLGRPLGLYLLFAAAVGTTVIASWLLNAILAVLS